MSRIVLALSHSIEEYDQLRLLTGIGHEVFSIGGYIKPAAPHDPKRPALDVPYYPDLHAAVDAIGGDDNLGAARARLPDAILDWADILIYHHRLERLYGQWDRIVRWRAANSARRVIWRTVGQSVANNERQAAPYRAEGLEIVRYSPRERNIPGYVGEDALIRFYKDPAEYGGWRGEIPQVITIVQHLRQREPYTNWSYWDAATRGLAAVPIGPGSEVIGGRGETTYQSMKAALQENRVYLYTGTQPASYTLGLIEAMMTGIPVVSIGPKWHSIFPYGPDLYEGHELAYSSHDDPADARRDLETYLDHPNRTVSLLQRQRAIDLFGIETISRQWAAYLS